MTSKYFAFELNMHLEALAERKISDLNLSKTLKLLSQYYPIKKKMEHLLFESPHAPEDLMNPSLLLLSLELCSSAQPVPPQQNSPDRKCDKNMRQIEPHNKSDS